MSAVDKLNADLPDVYIVQWTDSRGSSFTQELPAFPKPSDIPTGAVRMDVALSIVGRVTVFENPPLAAKPKGGDLARLAGIWCNDPDFQKWIMATDEISARKKICLKCGITSRAELDHNRQAAQYFHRLIREPYREHLQRQKAGA